MTGVPESAPPPWGPGDPGCFGCGPANGQGLRMTFQRTGESSVETAVVVPDHLCGAAAVVHGGIQATILDEAMGKAVHLGFQDSHTLRIVTAEMSVRYRRPALIGDQLVARAEVTRLEGRNAFVSAAILDSSGETVTTAEARWVVVGPRD